MTEKAYLQRLKAGREAAAKRRAQTHCCQGHEFTTENTYMRKDGRRQCIACQRHREAERRIRIRALLRIDPNHRWHGTLAGFKVGSCRCGKCLRFKYATLDLAKNM